MPSSAVPTAILEMLEQERGDLIAQLDELGFADGTNRGLDYDSNFADTSQVTAERGEAAALAGSLREALEEVEHALAKVESGAYGRCEKCGSEITTARLEAMPASRLCMQCASKAR